jgi:hypothetical protein
MFLEATHAPIRYRLKTGEEVTLRPGVPMQLPDQAATQLLKKAPDKVRRVDPLSTSLYPGSVITWKGADLTVRQGIVDFLHPDADGLVWVFVTMPDGGWAAVNSKYVEKVDP